MLLRPSSWVSFSPLKRCNMKAVLYHFKSQSSLFLKQESIGNRNLSFLTRLFLEETCWDDLWVSKCVTCAASKDSMTCSPWGLVHWEMPHLLLRRAPRECILNFLFYFQDPENPWASLLVSSQRGLFGGLGPNCLNFYGFFKASLDGSIKLRAHQV